MRSGADQKPLASEDALNELFHFNTDRLNSIKKEKTKNRQDVVYGLSGLDAF